MLQVGRQLTLGYGAVITAIVVTALVALGALLTIAHEKDDVARTQAEGLQRVSDLRWRAEQVVTASRGYLLTAHPRYLDRFQQANDAFGATLTRVPSPPDSRKAGDLAQIRRAWSRYYEAADLAAHRRSEEGDKSVVPFFERVLSPDRDALEAALAALERDERDELADATARSKAIAHRAAFAVAFTTFVSLTVSLWLAATTRRRLADQFGALQAQTARAEHAAAARDELIAVVSHDLRSPLAAILINADLALRRLPQEAGPRRLVERLRHAAERMGHLIDELVDVARVEGPGLVLRRERCDVAPLVDEVLQLFEPQAASKSVRLRAAVPASPGLAFVDRERIGRVLSNLCGNAVKFTPQGGEVTLRVEREEQRFVRFSVSDTGRGIAPAELPRIFDKHWQARREEGRGLGLGLYIARSLVEAHGGRIWVESTVGRGSTFSFRVPVTG
jgi:signal transduction histidine kinase